jgi:hypothetical protein
LVLFLLQINLGPTEFLVGVSGSIGPFGSLEKVITSLTFVTNARSYGPFGEGKGTHFHIPMQRNGCIVGFFGRARRYLHAIGVYMNHELEIFGFGEVQIHYIFVLPYNLCFSFILMFT